MSPSEYAIALELPEDIYVLSMVYAERRGVSIEDFFLNALKRELLDSLDSTNIER